MRRTVFATAVVLLNSCNAEVTISATGLSSDDLTSGPVRLELDTSELEVSVIEETIALCLDGCCGQGWYAPAVRLDDGTVLATSTNGLIAALDGLYMQAFQSEAGPTEAYVWDERCHPSPPRFDNVASVRGRLRRARDDDRQHPDASWVLEVRSWESR